MESRKNIICLFDVDGTLTEPRKVITNDMEETLQQLSSRVSIGLVGGSDIKKICEQMGGDSAIKKYDYVFSENGLVAYKNGELHSKQSILNYIGEEKLQKFINFCLNYMSKLNLPAKRGNFIEFRDSLINVCPVGRSCSQFEREQFNEYDKVNRIRETFIEDLKEEFPSLGLKFSIGGQISFDAFPFGWDKTYCLRLVEEDGFKTIYFLGDKTGVGGNDHEIFSDNRTIGNTVSSPQDTQELIKKLFLS